MMSPPCLESQGCQFDSTVLYRSPLLFFCLVLSLFLSYPFLVWAHSSNLFSPKPLFFPKGQLFCVALVVVLSGYGMSTLVGGMRSICCHMALILAFMHLYSIYNLLLFLSLLFFFF